MIGRGAKDQTRQNKMTADVWAGKFKRKIVIELMINAKRSSEFFDKYHWEMQN